MSSERPKRVIAILGMHRSGTSCLTGSLQQAGLFLGDHHAWNPYNLKGNRENQGFVDLNDAVLAANGASWDHPPDPVSWPGELQVRAQDLLRAHADHPVFGFKDPRTLLVLEGWKTLVPDLELIGIFRHPCAVAESLRRRSRKPALESMALWTTYNRILLRAWERSPFPLLCFDDDEATFKAAIRHASQFLSLPGNTDDEDFYSEDLKRAHTASDTVTRQTQHLYDQLRTRRIRP
ncbi:MAG: sulfotransferase family protein [Pseudomonadota bacterium]